MFLIINGTVLTDKTTDEAVEFTKILKNKNNIYCYQNDILYCAIERIEDINKFKVKDGEFSFPTKNKEETEKEKVDNLVQMIAKINLENKKKDNTNKMLAQTIASLNLRLNKLEKEKGGR